ncbi:TauD/TfdA family dioxygenase [Ramlibacter sp. AN1133]|uniref:TauD/TfdA family dioxygenase n=1 Tax=Ramlibacter sp. AN1133 TaxID=3133429 RepID=UPI0030C2E2BC
MVADEALPLFAGSMAWRAAELQDSEWRFALGAEVLAELERAIAIATCSHVPVDATRPEDFCLPAARALMGRVRQALQEGRGFALVCGLPVREWGQKDSTLAYWLLSSLIARPVAQNMAGARVYDVQDAGRKPEPGSGVRPDKTNVEQFFHNDNAYNRCQPDYVGLLCIRPAVEGGLSGVASIRTIHNELRRRHPDALPRLYQPFLFDRQKEHAPGEPPLVSAPIFAAAGADLKMRMGLFPLLNAYRLPGNELDAQGARSLDALKQVLADPALCHTFAMQAGEMQFVNNLGTCHRRTAFVDAPHSKRHMVRLWLREQGAPGYDG